MVWVRLSRVTELCVWENDVSAKNLWVSMRKRELECRFVLRNGSHEDSHNWPSLDLNALDFCVCGDT
jgi:hypothetical protein